ncbi:SDA1-domain-containing protein [Ascobolus immersus RN42]|uniref:Protein SDA1 n=1 Tax=Ascobolus immersus RN42 TaxID=1160509 RepID=A0A3N4IGS0_ASCIM|nr:SDA1-domain-containing protein [Ascobolus immersus RN42]
MPKRKRAALVKLTNLPLLQNLIRRDPGSYRGDFLTQYQHYEAQRDLFLAQPEGYKSDDFVELMGFMAQVTSCYPDVASSFPRDLIHLITERHAVLPADIREKVVQSLVLLRNKDVISSSTLLESLFPILTTTQSKALRTQIYNTIISDIRSSNTKAKNHKLNRTVQAVLFGLVEGGKNDIDSTVGLWAVKITRELWRRSVWDDAKSVEIMKECALSSNPKVIAGGVRFFLGVDKEKEEAVDSDDDLPTATDRAKITYTAQISISSKKKRKLERAVQHMKKKQKQASKPHPLNFSALHLLHDPQGFVESLFAKHLTKNTKLPIDLKLLVLQLTSRLIGLHKLELLAFYSFILKYLTPRQKDVTQFLACTAQASHDLVPPDALEPIVRKIADEFVSEGVASAVAAAGLNSIREICTRAPLAITPTLLQDLTEYKGSKDKSVVMAARGLIALYREIAPEMLKKKDRGKDATMGLSAGTKDKLRFGEEKAGFIEGLELLEEWKAQQKAARKEAKGETAEGEEGDDAEDEDEDEDEDAWGAWDVESDEDTDNEGWIEVESDKEIELSDSEDEDEKKKPATKKARKALEAAQEKEDEDGDDEEKKTKAQTEAEAAIKEEERNISKLAMTKILTPADFAKLAELRAQAGLAKATGTSLRTHNEDAVDTNRIEGVSFEKADKAARLAKVMEGREDREKFSSKKGKKLKEKAHSTTNKEKNRKKNFLMVRPHARMKQKGKLFSKATAIRKAGKQNKGK